MTPASAGQTAVWTILTIGFYLWIVLFIARRLGDASDQLEERQDYLNRLREDLDTATYIDAIGQHPVGEDVREWEGAFMLDEPRDAA